MPPAQRTLANRFCLLGAPAGESNSVLGGQVYEPYNGYLTDTRVFVSQALLVVPKLTAVALVS